MRLKSSKSQPPSTAPAFLSLPQNIQAGTMTTAAPDLTSSRKHFIWSARISLVLTSAEQQWKISLGCVFPWDEADASHQGPQKSKTVWGRTIETVQQWIPWPPCDQTWQSPELRSTCSLLNLLTRIVLPFSARSLCVFGAKNCWLCVRSAKEVWGSLTEKHAGCGQIPSHYNPSSVCLCGCE